MIRMGADLVSGEVQTPFPGWSQTAELLYKWQKKQKTFAFIHSWSANWACTSSLPTCEQCNGEALLTASLEGSRF